MVRTQVKSTICGKRTTAEDFCPVLSISAFFCIICGHEIPWSVLTWNFNRKLLMNADRKDMKSISTFRSAAPDNSLPLRPWVGLVNSGFGVKIHGVYILIVAVNDRQESLLCTVLFRGKARSEEHTSELQSHSDLVCRLLLEKKKMKYKYI